jgi:leucyl aminopeptidase (aminopeptidase T)
MTSEHDHPSILWSAIARRVVEGVGVQPGELVMMRDGADHPTARLETMLAVEQAGATPLLEPTTPTYLQGLLQRVAPEHLHHWDLHRMEWVRRMDRRIVLQGASLDLSGAPEAALAAWQAATARLTVVDEERKVRVLLVAVPTLDRARQLDIPLEELETIVLPALAVPADDLRSEIQHALNTIGDARTLTLHTGEGCTLQVSLGDRHWHSDDGVIDEADRSTGAIASNLPAGSIYSTIVEESAEGTLHLPQAGPARDVTLHFEHGRIVRLQAREGGTELTALFDRHTGGSRYISHLGIGLNPYLHRPTGWILVDEHIHGTLFIAFGENRYMGGRNTSSLNIDFCVTDATMEADGRVVLQAGVMKRSAEDQSNR